MYHFDQLLALLFNLSHKSTTDYQCFGTFYKKPSQKSLDKWNKVSNFAS